MNVTQSLGRFRRDSTTVEHSSDVAPAEIPTKPIDQGGIQLIDPLIYRGNEAYKDTIDWLVSQQKKERPGDKPGSV